MTIFDVHYNGYYGHLDDSAKVELGETMASLLGKNKTEEKENGSRDHHQGTTL